MQDIKTYSKLKCFIFHEEIHNLNYERLAIVIMLKGELHSIAKGFYNLKKIWLQTLQFIQNMKTGFGIEC